MRLQTLFYRCVLLLGSTEIWANDSTGYVGTGGVTYKKNLDITMQSENLFISKQLIKVDYEFRNESKKDISETVLFPLPAIEAEMDGDFADTAKLIQSFKVKVNGQALKPKMNVRAFMSEYPLPAQGEAVERVHDVTAALIACGLTEQELMNPWYRQLDSHRISNKIKACQQPQIQKLLSMSGDEEVLWSAQIIYSWQQTFKANSITRVQHQYQPLLGGAVAWYDPEHENPFCMDASFQKSMKRLRAEQSGYYSLSYILTTGKNWANKIENFKLTVEKDPKELVSFCWDGPVKKISATQFQATMKNFVPQKELEVIFLQLQR